MSYRENESTDGVGISRGIDTTFRAYDFKKDCPINPSYSEVAGQNLRTDREACLFLMKDWNLEKFPSESINELYSTHVMKSQIF